MKEREQTKKKKARTKVQSHSQQTEIAPQSLPSLLPYFLEVPSFPPTVSASRPRHDDITVASHSRIITALKKNANTTPFLSFLFPSPFYDTSTGRLPELPLLSSLILLAPALRKGGRKGTK